MYRNRRERRRRRTDYRDRIRSGRGLTSAFRTPGAQIGVLLVVALVIYLILQMSGGNAPAQASAVGVEEAYQMYQNGAFVLDVRTPEEWNEYHIPNTTLIPLDQLSARLGEVPRDRPIVVVCRSGNRSQEGRDILLNAGFEGVVSMTGGLNEWRAGGYPVEP
jgi:phage shock protein E